MNAFVDTNVLVYAADKTAQPSPKTQIARELLLQERLHLSVQVLNEFYVNARHPKKLDLSPQQTLEWIERWLLFDVHPLTSKIFLEALRFEERYQISHWDGLILATAQQAKCETLYSEDLQHRQTYFGITMVNPFLM